MNKTIITLVVLMSICATADAQQWRVVSRVYNSSSKGSPGLTVKDSIHFYYNYSSGRGSDSTFDISLDTKTLYHKDGVWCDSSLKFTRVTTSGPEGVKVTNYVSNKCERTYDSADKLLTTKYYQADTLANEDRYTYDTAYNLIRFVNNTDDYTYDYDTANKLIKAQHIDLSRNVTLTNEYTYDTLGLLIKDTAYYSAGSSTCTYYTYDTFQNRTKETRYEYLANSTSPIDTYLLYHIYNQASQLVTDSSLYTARTSGAYDLIRYTYYPDGKLYEAIGANSTTFYTYTSFGYYNSIGIYHLSTPINGAKFHYEHYWPADVASAVKNEADLKVYPVPANSLLHVEASFQEGGKLQGSVTDMQGRVVYHWNDDATKHYKKQIYLNHLPSGIYMLQIYTDNEVATKQFIKQ